MSYSKFLILNITLTWYLESGDRSCIGPDVKSKFDECICSCLQIPGGLVPGESWILCVCSASIIAISSEEQTGVEKE